MSRILGEDPVSTAASSYFILFPSQFEDWTMYSKLLLLTSATVLPRGLGSFFDRLGSWVTTRRIFVRRADVTLVKRQALKLPPEQARTFPPSGDRWRSASISQDLSIAALKPRRVLQLRIATVTKRMQHTHRICRQCNPYLSSLFEYVQHLPCSHSQREQ